MLKSVIGFWANVTKKETKPNQGWKNKQKIFELVSPVELMVLLPLAETTNTLNVV